MPNVAYMNRLMAEVPETVLADFADLELEDDQDEYIEVIRRLGQLGTD